MSHLDEGTIHAWLDGALSTTQSAEVDAHVKGCAECSAKVAEARGLIAASSRILTSLDDTPANVIPKPAVAPARRRRSLAPWISGLAAAAILITVWRTGDVQQPASMAELRVPEIAQVQIPEPSLEPLSQPAPPPTRVAVTTDSARQQLQRKVGNVVGGGALGAAAAVAPAAAETFAAEAVQRTRESRKDESSLIGCYVVTAPRLDEVVVTGAAEAPRAGGAVRSRTAVSAAGAPAAVSAQKSADMAMPSVTVRLDSGSVVRRGESRDSVGTWVATTGDSVRVSLGGRTTVVAQSSKVRCP